MSKTYTEIYFSEVTRNADGTKASETSILETLAIEWDANRRRFKASNLEGHSSQCGYGTDQTEAVLDYLRLRLGIEVKPPTIHYSNRTYSGVRK